MTTRERGRGYGSGEAQRAWNEWRKAWLNVEYWLNEANDEESLTEARAHRRLLFEAFVAACRRARV